MKIATWNVNSLPARFPHVERYIREHNPDVLLLQEIKTLDSETPTEFFANLGYNVALFGQKSYNGVAIASRHSLEDVTHNIPDFVDENARYIEAFTGGVRVASVYVPNGQELASDKFVYKMDFLEALHTHMHKLLSYDEQIIIGGDFNIAPFAIDTCDYKTPEELHTSLKERSAFRKLLGLGYTDVLRMSHPHKEQWFSWWDYRAGSWNQNKGLRIDHMLMSPQACDTLQECGIENNPRGWERPSDHAPVWVHMREYDKLS